MKNVVFREDLHKKLKSGSNKLVEAVGSTLGPNGHNVILSDDMGNVSVTKDGVTVARFFDLEDSVENLACQIIKQSSIETGNRAGDGTTTSTILADAIYRAGLHAMESNSMPLIDLKFEIEAAAKQVKEYIASIAIEIGNKEQVKNIATISANGDDAIGSLIADAVHNVGKAGSIVVEKSGENETILDFVEGFTLDVGYRAPAFVNKKRLNMAQYESPLVLVTDLAINNHNFEQFRRVFAYADKEGRPLVIVADDVDDKPLALLIMNALKDLPVLVVKPPRYGSERRLIMEDLAISLGGRFISSQAGDTIGRVKLEDLGTCATIECTKIKTVFSEGVGSIEAITERMEQIKSEMHQMKDADASERLQERLTRMSAGIAVIRVGGTTQVEVDEKKYRIEDALEAVRSAKEEGIVPGGGTVFLKARDLFFDCSDPKSITLGKTAGERVIYNALLAPFEKLYETTFGKLTTDVISSIQTAPESVGINFRTKERVDNLIEEGVVDPAKVLRTALENAVSAATTLLLANTAILEE